MRAIVTEVLPETVDPTPDPAPTAEDAAPRRSLRSDLVDAAGLSAIVVVITAWVFRLWDTDLRLPFLYNTDGISQLREVKGVLENGWYQFNSSVGWPTGLDHRDFPAGSDNLHYALIKVIGFFSSDAVLVTNLYFLLTFVLVALTAFFVARALGVGRVWSYPVAVLYTFLPYHFLRGTWHLSLAAYFMVPIACLITVRIWDAAPPFLVRRADGKTRLDLKAARTWWYVLGIVALALTGVYYVAFTIALVAIVAALRLVVARDWRPLASAVLVVGILGATTMVANLPSILYWRDAGTNDVVAERSVAESDFYALRPIQLISPVPAHRVGFLSEITDRVLRAPNNSEAQFLGLFSSLGLLGLLIVLLGVPRERAESDDRRRGPPLLVRLASLTGIAFLLGVTGGFSWILGFAGLKEIRSWNRISILIAFYALVALGIWAGRAVSWSASRWPKFSWRTPLTVAVAALVIVVGVLDQTSPAIVPKTENAKAAWDSDEAFVQEIEDTLGPGGAVFQLPYLPFPEASADLRGFGMADYDPTRGYLHSDDLRWSYGALRGRDGDWQREVVKLPTDELLAAITAVGFDGLWIDRLGYPEQAAELEAEVEALTSETPIVQSQGRFSFFHLRAYAKQVRAELGADGVRELRRETLADLPRR